MEDKKVHFFKYIFLLYIKKEKNVVQTMEKCIVYGDDYFTNRSEMVY